MSKAYIECFDKTIYYLSYDFELNIFNIRSGINFESDTFTEIDLASGISGTSLCSLKILPDSEISTLMTDDKLIVLNNLWNTY